MLIAMINFFIGSILLATVPLNQTYWAQTFISVLIMPGAMNLSFPAATILLSSALPKEKQGMAASLVSTMVNYCISCGLGLAGSIHRQSFKNAAGLNNGSRGGVQNPPPSALPLLSASPPGLDRIRIQSFRGPWWFAVALSAIGVVIATMFIIRVETQKRSRKSAKVWRQTHWFGAPKEGKT
jgi:MFS family permease